MDELASIALTDGTDDKSVDACYINRVERRAIVSQAYFAQEWGRGSAKLSKASSLNQAMSWLLTAQIESVPLKIRAHAEELRAALKDQALDKIEVVYVHNCQSTEVVQSELYTIGDHTRAVLQSSGYPEVLVSAREWGIREIENLWRSRDRDILVEQEFEISTSGLFVKEGDGWKAVVFSVPGEWLHDQFVEFEPELFSANLREYLGVRRHKGNINNTIRETASACSNDFWIFNNGVTALTNKLDVDQDSGVVRLHGLSIINGAQTTGALGEADKSSISGVHVLCRIVQCDLPELVSKIIRYNNTQNEIRPADIRSNDAVQVSLVEGFNQYGVSYVSRRSRRKSAKGSISALSVGSSLVSFHGRPQIALRSGPEIFLSDDVYESIFTADLTSEHVYLVSSLSSAIDEVKNVLKKKVAAESATELELLQYEVLRYSAAKHYMLYLLGSCREEIFGAKIAHPNRWMAKATVIKPSDTELRVAWESVVKAILPLVQNTTEVVGSPYDVSRSMEESKKVAGALRSLIAALSDQLAPVFLQLRSLSRVS